MAFQQGLWRNSVWGRDNYDIALHGLEASGEEPSNGSSSNGRPPSTPEPVSRWSTDSNDNDDGDARGFSRLSRLICDAKLDTPEQSYELLPSPLPRAYTRPQTPRRNGAQRGRRNARNERERQRRQPDAISLEDARAPEPLKMSLSREVLFVTTICVAHLCAQAGIGQTLPIMKSVASRFRVANATNLSSSITGYAVVLGTSILIARRLGKTFGHKPVFMVGLVWSAASSLIVGASFYSTRSLFIASRAFQGLGAALTLPTGLALLNATRPTGTRKTVIMSLYAAMSPSGIIIGALGASVIDELTWWPWVYWAFSITLIALRAISRFVIPSTLLVRRPPSGARAAIVDLDIPGIITLCVSLGLFGFAWSQAYAAGWLQGYIWIILVAGVVLTAVFAMIEVWYSRNPLISHSAQSLEIFWILVATGSGWSCFGIWVFYGWQFMQRFRSAPPLLITAYFSPVLLVGCFAAVTTRSILVRFRPQGIFCVAMLAMMLGSVLIATMPIKQTYWQQLFISTVFMAWGLYMTIPMATVMVSSIVNRRDRGIATSLVWLAIYYGMGLGLAVAGTVEHGVMGAELTVHNRFRGHRAVYWTSVGLAGLGLGLAVCLAFVSRSRREPVRRRPPRDNRRCHRVGDDCC